MEKLLLFVLLLFASIVTMDRGQAASDMAFYFGVYSVNPVPGFSPTKGTCNCKNSKRILLTLTVDGGDGEERVVVQSLEYNSSDFPVSPPCHETVIDINQTPLQMAQTIPGVGEEHSDTSRKVDGGAFGGGGEPGGGGGGPGDDGPDDDNNTYSNSDGDGNENGEVGEILSKFQRKTLKKLAKISISITAQTGIALVALQRDKPTFIVYMVVAISVCAYFLCLLSIISEKKSTAAITAAIGTLFTAVGFLLTMCIIVLPFSIWAFVLSCLLLVISIVFFIIP